MTLADINTVNGVRFTLEDGAWGLVRASSNTPNLVVVCESSESEAEMRAIFSPYELHGFELILGGLTLRLLLPLEDLHVEQRLPLLGGAAPSYFHLVLLAHVIVLSGPAAASSLARGDVAAALAVPMGDLTEIGLALYGVLHSEAFAFHARKHVVSFEMMRKYSDNPMVHRHPCLIPGFLTIMPHLAKAFARHVAEGQKAGFPQWQPPMPWGDWTRVG